MRVLVCGGRQYEARFRVWRELSARAPTWVCQGGARGVDLFAREWCEQNGVRCCTYYPHWSAFGSAAGPRRNQLMLDDFKPEIVLAFPGGPGTSDMVKRAKKCGVPVEVIVE